MSIIISETKNGHAFPYSAFTCRNEADFINRIREVALQRRSDEALDIETTEAAISYLNETFAQRTEVITKADYTEGMGDKVDDCAIRLEWKDE